MTVLVRFESLASAAALVVGSLGFTFCLYLLCVARLADIEPVACGDAARTLLCDAPPCVPPAGLNALCFALSDDPVHAWLSERAAADAARQTPATTAQWLAMCALALIMCLPCCFVGGILSLLVAFGFDVPLLAKLSALRCDVRTDAATKQV